MAAQYKLAHYHTTSQNIHTSF